MKVATAHKRPREATRYELADLHDQRSLRKGQYKAKEPRGVTVYREGDRWICAIKIGHEVSDPSEHLTEQQAETEARRRMRLLEGREESDE